MKIREQDFYYGCVLAQIADHGASATVKISGRNGLYEINGDRQILIKYATTEGREWAFVFKKNEIATLKADETHTRSFLVLVCGYRTICLLDADDIGELFDENTRKIQTITVALDRGNRLRVRNGDVKLSRMVPQKAFPAKLLDEPPPTEEPLAWPALSTIRVYREPPNQLFSSEDRSFDLSDVLTHNLSANEIGIAYVGVLTQNTAWEIWDERALRRIEERIGYLFRFDSFGIEIERVTTESNTWCTDEFVWKIKFWSDFGALDTLNDDSVESMLATDDFQS